MSTPYSEAHVPYDLLLCATRTFRTHANCCNPSTRVFAWLTRRYASLTEGGGVLHSKPEKEHEAANEFLSFLSFPFYPGHRQPVLFRHYHVVYNCSSYV
jgi:hypothetical protein